MLSREQVRKIDRTAIDVLGIPGIALMENAGRGCADHIGKILKARRFNSIAVIAGSGNNGGDGYVIARHLSLRGYAVKTFIIAPREKITGDAKINLDVLASLKADFEFIPEARIPEVADMLCGFDVIVDAVGGTGITGALRGAVGEVVKQINICGESKFVVAVDIPTGLDCDSGKADGPVVKANLTVTFIDEKTGFANVESKDYTGQVVVADIGIPYDVVAGIQMTL